MFKKFSLIVLCLVLVQTVTALKCFFSEASNNGTVVPDLEDCRTPKAKNLYSYLRHYKDEDLRCFNLVGHKAGKSSVRKGCMAKGECSESLFRAIAAVTMEDPKCYECAEDGCNVASKHTAFGLFGLLITSLVLIFYNFINT